MYDRLRKIDSLVQKEVGELILSHVDLKPGVLATISRVDTVEDLSQAKVYIQSFPSQEQNYVMKTLEKEHHVLQGALHKKLHLKVMPKIIFVEDLTGETVEEISTALRSEH